MITIEELKEDLCFYDKRSPYYDSEDSENLNDCYCDNCFYGRHELANELLIIKEKERLEAEKIDWTRINNDVNGNPRYVCHFYTLSDNYERAVKLANSLGGRKYHTKNYGGGLVFQSYNTEALEDKLKKIKEN